MVPFDPEHPDALLVAASPDLVEALQAYVYAYNGDEAQDYQDAKHLHDKALEALKKAGAL